jgi:heptosyltransferase-3
MAPIYVSRSLWEYKFRKLSYWFSACIAYIQLFIRIRLERIIHPVVGILLAEHLGDIIAAEPIIDELRKKHPNARIVWIVKSPFKDLLIHHPHIDRVIVEHSLLSSIWLTVNNPFSHFYNLHLSGLRYDTYFRRELYNAQAELIGLNQSNYYTNRNLLRGFYELCGITYQQSKQPYLYLGEVSTTKLPANYWVIHRKSNGKDREWQDEGWITLIQQALETYDVNIIEVGVSEGLSFSHPKFISLVGKTSISEMAKIIAGADFFLGIDSGPTHIANAFEIPGLILLGQYKNFKNHMPYSGAYELGRATIYHYPNGSSVEIPAEIVWQQLSNIKPIPEKKLA